MHVVHSNLLTWVLLPGLIAGTSIVSALEIEPGIGGGLLYTDNARLAGDNEVDDTIVVGYAGVSIKEDRGAFSADVIADALHLNYIDDTFSDQTYPQLQARANWDQVRDRLGWSVQNYLTQTRIDSLDGVTPSNVQNTNAFSFGPTITFPVSGRDSLSISPQFQDYRFENFGSDYQQYILGANWAHQMRRTVGLNLSGAVTRAEFDDDGVSSYTRTQLYAGVSGTGVRSTYTLNIGGTHVDNEKSSNTGGFTGDLDGLYQITGHSSVRAFLSSEITSSGEIYVNSEIDPDTGSFTNVQTADEVVRSTIARLTYRRVDATLNSLVWAEYRNLDYKESTGNRDAGQFGAKMDYAVTSLITTSLFGTVDAVDEKDFDRKDMRYSLTGGINYSLSRKLRVGFDLRYQQQNSDAGSANEYRALSGFVNLVYGFAQVSRPL